MEERDGGIQIHNAFLAAKPVNPSSSSYTLFHLTMQANIS